MKERGARKTTKAFITILVVSLFTGCLQVQLNGPVAGATVTVTELRNPSQVLLEASSWTEQDVREIYGAETWDSLGALLQYFLYGGTRLDTTGLEDDELYLLTASGGSDIDAANRDLVRDEEFTPVAGNWRAIMSGAQIKSLGPKVSALTEVAYLWLEPHLDTLDDARVTNNLDLLAQSLLQRDLTGDQLIDAWDIIRWSRMLDGDKLMLPTGSVSAIADSIIAGASEESRSLLADTLISLEVTSDYPLGGSPAEQVRDQLRGLDFDAFMQASFDAVLYRYPEWIVELGLEGYELDGDELNDVSDAYARDTFDVMEAILAALSRYDRASLSDEQQVSYDVYQWYLEDVLAEEASMLVSYPASSFITGVPYQTAFFFTDIQPMVSAQDARDYVARLAGVANKFDQLRAAVAARAEAGVIEPAITLRWATDYYQSFATAAPTSSPYYARLSAALNSITGLSDSERAALRSEALAIVDQQVIPSYRALQLDLLELLPDAPDAIGIGQFERGDKAYQYALQHHTTTDLSAEEIHQLGLDEMARVQQEINAAAVALGYEDGISLGDLFFQVYGDGGILSGQNILSTYEDLIEFAYGGLEAAFDQLPQQEVVVIGGQFGGFYVAGSDDGSRPGAFYARTVGDEGYYTMPTIAYHEAVPGHHLQIALAQEQGLPAFQRFTNFTGYAEGWALYAERLAYELGWYQDDPYGNLGRLYWEGIRAARLATDTGIHYYGWSWREAFNFFVENTGMPDSFARGSIGRFMRWPGQATAYMTGFKRILDMRQQYQQAQGSGYDIKEFHNLILLGGSMPLPVLQDVVNREIGN